MGHDISLYRLRKDPIDEKKLAYIGRSAFNAKRHEIYEIMGMEDHNNDVSGDGSDVILRACDFEEEVDGWIEKAQDEDLKVFFTVLKEYMNKDGQVLITFY